MTAVICWACRDHITQRTRTHTHQMPWQPSSKRSFLRSPFGAVRIPLMGASLRNVPSKTCPSGHSWVPFPSMLPRNQLPLCTRPSLQVKVPTPCRRSSSNCPRYVCPDRNTCPGRNTSTMRAVTCPSSQNIEQKLHDIGAPAGMKHHPPCSHHGTGSRACMLQGSRRGKNSISSHLFSPTVFQVVQIIASERASICITCHALAVSLPTFELSRVHRIASYSHFLDKSSRAWFASDQLHAIDLSGVGCACV